MENLYSKTIYYFRIGAKNIPVETEIISVTTTSVINKIFTPDPRYLRLVYEDGFGLANQTFIANLTGEDKMPFITNSKDSGGVAFDLNSVNGGQGCMAL